MFGECANVLYVRVFGSSHTIFEFDFRSIPSICCEITGESKVPVSRRLPSDFAPVGFLSRLRRTLLE